MTTYARVQNNTIIETFVLPNISSTSTITGPTGLPEETTAPATINDFFVADIASQFIVVPDGTATGSTLVSGVWAVPAAPVVTAPTYASISPATFYAAFTAAEMIAIKASTDPMVKEFYARFQIFLQTNAQIDPNLVSVQEGLAYLAASATPGPGAGILASTARIAQISAGVPQ